MRVMLTGGKGMLGRTICRIFPSDMNVIPTDLPEVDITSRKSLEDAVEKYSPDAVIHCAAMTAVDRCETEKELAFRLNAFGTANVAAVCRKYGIRLIAISTDYVFQGDSDRPYHEYDPAGHAGTVYGQSKFAGEEQVRIFCPDHVIARISWLYGFGGPSFVHTMRKLADGTRPVLKVVHDQIGNPTSAVAVARKLEEILRRPELCGTFHLTCEGEASWYEFALEIFRQMNIRQEVQPCRTDEFPRPAPRPANSRLDKMMLRLNGMTPMPDWKDALAEFIKLEFEGK